MQIWVGGDSPAIEVPASEIDLGHTDEVFVVANRYVLWIFFIHLSLCAWADSAKEQSLKIYVYNQAGVPGIVLIGAEQKADRIFRLSGLQASWISCSTAGSPGTNCSGLPQAADVVLQIVHETKNLRDDIFGAAFLGRDGTGQYTDVYYNRLEELHRDWNVPLESVLAHVMAHEIGHILLGLNAHSNVGIMRGSWDSEEISALERGRLLFSSQQSRAMKDHVMAMSANILASAGVRSSSRP